MMSEKARKPQGKSPNKLLIFLLIIISLLLAPVLATLVLMQVGKIRNATFRPTEINSRERIKLLQKVPEKQLIFTEKMKTGCPGSEVDKLEISFSYDDFSVALEKEIVFLKLKNPKDHPLVKFQTALASQFKTRDKLQAEEILADFLTNNDQTNASFNRISKSLLDEGKAFLTIQSDSTQAVPFITKFMTGSQVAPLMGSGHTGYELPNAKTFKCGSWIS